MKFMRTLFQITVLLMMLAVFSHPLRADASDAPLKTDSPLAQSTPATKGYPAHLSTSRIIAGIKTGFIGGVVPVMALFLFGRALRLMAVRSRPEVEVAEEPLVVVPPLRTTPDRVTKF